MWCGTKRRAPLIGPANELLLFEVDKTGESGGEVLAVNAVSDHVHVAATIPPKVAVADWVKRVKGVSAYEINLRFPDSLDSFHWQDSYGVLTFGAKNLDTVVDYIQRQKEHHAQNTLIDYLEQVE